MITSTSNARVKQLVQLRKKARERDAQDVFLAEGTKLFQEAPPEQILQVYVSENYYRKRKALFDGYRQVTVLSDRVFASVSDTRTPQGVLLVMRQSHYQMQDLCGKPPCLPFLIVLENLQDPGNLGTILRTAEAAGVTGILLGAGCADLYNPKTIRSTMGAVFRMPFFYTEDLEESLRTLQGNGVRFFAAHPEKGNFYDREAYTQPVGFLIGNESRGLTEETAALADGCVRIPMGGQAESLNAAVAAAVLMYEVNRQRRS